MVIGNILSYLLLIIVCAYSAIVFYLEMPKNKFSKKDACFALLCGSLSLFWLIRLINYLYVEICG